MKRRPLLALGLATPAAAQGEFAPQVDTAGRRLVLNGVGSRLYSVFAVEVYRAALYLEAPSRDPEAILASPGAKLIIARYRREMPLRGVVAVWEQSLQPMPEAFRAWLALLAAGTEERFFFAPGSVQLEGSGRPTIRIADAEFARRLLLAWIGPAAPTEALRQGLLGLTP